MSYRSQRHRELCSTTIQWVYHNSFQSLIDTLINQSQQDIVVTMLTSVLYLAAHPMLSVMYIVELV